MSGCTLGTHQLAMLYPYHASYLCLFFCDRYLTPYAKVKQPLAAIIRLDFWRNADCPVYVLSDAVVPQIDDPVAGCAAQPYAA